MLGSVACVVNEWWIRAQVLLMQTSRSASIKTLKYQASSGSYIPDVACDKAEAMDARLDSLPYDSLLLVLYFGLWKGMW